MKCCSRSTLGVVIGSLNVLLYIVLSVAVILSIVKLKSVKTQTAQQKDPAVQTRVIFIILLIFCLAMAIISGLFVVGIVKRRHKLMIPWLLLGAIGFVCNCTHYIYVCIGSTFSGASVVQILLAFFVGVVVFGISLLILWPIFILFGDIQKENNQKTGCIIRNTDVEYHTPGK